jgi:hypothetical protein
MVDEVEENEAGKGSNLLLLGTGPPAGLGLEGGRGEGGMPPGLPGVS